MIDKLIQKAKSDTLSVEDLAYLIVHHAPTRLDYYLNNNIYAVNQLLRTKLGYGYLPFTPDKQKIAYALDVISKSNDLAAIELLDKEVQFNSEVENFTTNQALLTEIKKQNTWL